MTSKVIFGIQLKFVLWPNVQDQHLLRMWELAFAVVAVCVEAQGEFSYLY